MKHTRDRAGAVLPRHSGLAIIKYAKSHKIRLAQNDRPRDSTETVSDDSVSKSLRSAPATATIWDIAVDLVFEGDWARLIADVDREG